MRHEGAVLEAPVLATRVAGVPKLFMESFKLGAKKERLVVSVAGGAVVGSSERGDFFEIGKRNMIVLRKILWKNGVILKATDVAGNVSRQMRLFMGDGRVTVRADGAERILVSPSAVEKVRALHGAGVPASRRSVVSAPVGNSKALNAALVFR